MQEYKQTPIYQKAEEIIHLTRALVETMDQEHTFAEIGNQMVEDAYILGAKIAGATGLDIYSDKMEKAVLIKVSACSLQASTTFCSEEGLADPEHLRVLSDEIENFRVLFVDWINTFHECEDYDDGWGLFQKD